MSKVWLFPVIFFTDFDFSVNCNLVRDGGLSNSVLRNQWGYFKLEQWFTQRRQWHPTPVLLLGKSHGRRSLVGCSPRVRHDWATSLSLFTFMHWRRTWQPTPVFLPGESQGWEPGGLPSMGSHRGGHTWRDSAAAAVVHNLDWILEPPW